MIRALSILCITILLHIFRTHGYIQVFDLMFDFLDQNLIFQFLDACISSTK
jgi:hypothetical protein